QMTATDVNKSWVAYGHEFRKIHSGQSPFMWEEDKKTADSETARSSADWGSVASCLVLYLPWLHCSQKFNFTYCLHIIFLFRFYIFRPIALICNHLLNLEDCSIQLCLDR
ncbi:hypothetical protein L9F63_014617, partial [Diploptera punctata]